jgi:succinyl-CoA synthetase beta subunit
MIESISAKALLGAFRGMKPVNLKKMTDIIVGLSRLAEDFPQIRELDINPIIVDNDGNPRVVDALIEK